jgi:dUTP pyrophosphatase
MDIKTVVLRTPQGITAEQLLTPATPGSAAIDLYANWDRSERELTHVLVFNGMTTRIHTGLKMEIPYGYAGLVLPRSGLSIKDGLKPANSPGLLDPDYRGEIIVGLCNQGEKLFTIQHGMRIAQLLIIPVAMAARFAIVAELSPTLRGDGALGSTGQ